MDNALKFARLRKKLNITQAAEQLGVSGVHYSHVERGLRRPSFQLMGRIEQIFGVSYKDVMTIPYIKHIQIPNTYPRRSKEVTIDELFGIDPDFTGEEDAVEFLSRERG